MGMVVERVSIDEVQTSIVTRIGLASETLDLSSPEVLSELIRRAASFSCPTTPGELLRSVRGSLRALRDDEVLTDELSSLIQDLIGYGDLIELPVEDSRGIMKRHLYLAPPSVVQRSGNTCFLVGIRPEGAPLLADTLMSRVEYENYVRRLSFETGETASEICEANELQALSSDHWLAHPRPTSEVELIAEYDARLSAAGPAGTIEELTILDFTTPSTYYRGRWRSLRHRDAGHFVARRPQAFGADLWCYAEIEGGVVVRLLDLPVQDRLARGSDEAWRLQAAIDSVRGHPQRGRIGSVSAHTAIHFRCPLPSWAQRRLDVVGIRLVRHAGYLISYSVPSVEVEEELTFLKDLMWITSGTE
jgi:hypothetical protein